MYFSNDQIDFDILQKRAYNLRWASVPEGVIPLTAADPDFKCAPAISEGITKYIKEGYFSYTPAEGLPEFKYAVQEFLRTHRNVEIPSANVLPVDSAAYAIYLTCKTFLAPGDEAIIFDPVDFLFQYSIEQVGAKAVRFPIPPQQDKVDFNDIEHIITSRTKMICLCNPLNPTGKVFTKEELNVLGELAVQYNLIILSDEIWSDIVFPPSVFTSIGSLTSEISRQVVIISGFSKSYGLAGLRIGLVATSNTKFFQSLFENSLHQSTVHGANALGQIAAVSALQDAQEWLKEFVSHLIEVRDYAVERINRIPGLSVKSPEGCYVLFVNIKKTGMSSQLIYEFLLNEAKVAVVPGLPRWFGDCAEGHIRICFSTSLEVMKEALDRIEKVMVP